MWNDLYGTRVLRYLSPHRQLDMYFKIIKFKEIIPPNLLAFKGFKARLIELFSFFVSDALFFLRRNLKELLTSMNNNLI